MQDGKRKSEKRDNSPQESVEGAKVIPFPPQSKSLNKKSPVDNLSSKKFEPSKFKSTFPFVDVDPRQLITISSMLIIFLTVGLLNYQLSRQQEDSMDKGQGRGLASAPLVEPGDKKLAESQLKLLRAGERDVASLGSHPTLEERFRLETLEGKYAVRFQGGHVEEARYIEPISSLSQPMYIPDRASFLAQHHRLMADSVSQVVHKSEERTEDKFTEVYSLLDSSHQVLGEAFFEMDRYGRVLAIRIHPIKD